MIKAGNTFCLKSVEKNPKIHGKMSKNHDEKMYTKLKYLLATLFN